jgi:hypothetical protein
MGLYDLESDIGKDTTWPESTWKSSKMLELISAFRWPAKLPGTNVTPRKRVGKWRSDSICLLIVAIASGVPRAELRASPVSLKTILHSRRPTGQCASLVHKIAPAPAKLSWTQHAELLRVYPSG